LYEGGSALLSLIVMMGCFLAGTRAQRLLKEVHRSQHSIESIRVIITLLATFAALVLGLVISAAQARFSMLESGMRTLSANVTELDSRLRDYGPETASIRQDLSTYTKAAIASTWPSEPAPPGDYPRVSNSRGDGSLESVELGALLNKIDLAIRRLSPQDNFHQSIAASLRTRIVTLIDQRWMLIENSHRSLKWPFLTVLLFWLGVIFVIAGLNSPHNSLVLTVALLASLSIASSIYLAFELDSPFSGIIALSSAPLRDALADIGSSP
jgi:hypothetical protein